MGEDSSAETGGRASRSSSDGEDADIRLRVSDLQKLGESSGLPVTTSTIFEPQGSGIEKQDSGDVGDLPLPSSRAPETKLTLFALRLAVFEKAATGLGTLGFIWATVVLLGGFAITLDKTDFWFVTIILLIEGTRIFSRSHELEWQHQVTWSIAEAGINSFRALKSSSHLLFETAKSVLRPVFRFPNSGSPKRREIAADRESPKPAAAFSLDRRPTRMWATSEVPILPYGKWVFLSKNISRLLYWLQLLSATACVVLSMIKLVRRNFGDVAKSDTDKRNRKAALLIFYSLALAEALLFLMEKAYWEWKISCCKLLEEVANECELKMSGLFSVRRFFYDSYSRCINGSIFDGLGMDMITFSMELLNSNIPDEQLIGARILRQFTTSNRFSDDTLRKIGSEISVLERLVEMVNWKDHLEEEIRLSAAEILSKLSARKQYALRVAGIPGAMESISSLLHANRNPSVTAEEIGEKSIILDEPNYGLWTFNHLGLLILKKLAQDHDNCGKIGNTRGLLPKVVDFTHATERMLKDENVAKSQIQTVKRSLQLLKMLSSTTGATGKQLRREISEIVFSISNIRDILRHGERHPNLQKLGIDVLTRLALEEDATLRIGGTGGVLKELLNIFFSDNVPVDQNEVRIAAGDALAMLALESRTNCQRILKLNAMGRLVEALRYPLLRINAARILRNLCEYAGEDSYYQLKEITVAATPVLKATFSDEEKLQEVMVGLAAQIFKFMTSEELSIMFERAKIRESELAISLVEILRKYRDPPVKVPRIRRFAIELAIWMMRDRATNVHTFHLLGMEEELEGVLETTSEVESFNIFSGMVGMCRHGVTIHSLVETAMKLLNEG
ncbi:hypothetical protein MLD38_020499 [Melastoma candidum]|uniref:Uncharacterized protein n=1 Tax=Melastoma candidum TaxID=119954 RepID=A0ACB9QL72_9MYRT|nr:hypothetical protein MLD38_020499 [Melastoma candidum]